MAEPWKELVTLPPQELKKIPYNDPRLDAFARAVEVRYDLPPGLIEAVKNAGERTQTTQVSPKGAKGVMQFIDSTREIYPHDYNNPLASIDASGRYFKDLIKRYNGNVKAAVSAYNGGTAAGKAVLKGQEAPAEETRKYWTRMQDYMRKKTQQEQKVSPAPVTPPEESLMDKVKRVAPPVVGGKGELVSDVFGSKQKEGTPDEGMIPDMKK